MRDSIMQRFVSNPTRHFALALVGTSLLVTLVLRYLWALSLGNGDELFFSTGAGAFNVPEGSWSQWGEFFSWLWWEHTGRTADWLSGAVYFFGDEEGRWIVSALTAFSAASITWSLHRLYIRDVTVSSRVWLIAPVAILSFVFSYSTKTLTALANLTMYSAAVSNYLVPTALIFIVITAVLTSEKTSTLYVHALLAGLVATMHEQAAAVLAVLVCVFLIFASERWSFPHRLGSSLVVLAGVVEMFMAPGLHAKLNRVAEASQAVPPSLPHKLVASFSSFGVYFPFLGILISIVTATYLIIFIRSNIRRSLAIGMLVTLCLSTFVWLVYLAAVIARLSFASKKIVGAACIIMMLMWLVTPLLSASKTVQFSSLLMLCAAGSFSIPAAAGLGAVRVYNYPVIFFIAFLVWSIYLAAYPPCGETTPPGRPVLSALLATCLLVMSIWVLTQATIAFRANYAPGLQDLEKQDSQCTLEICQAKDPAIPYPPAMSGYGDHDYASTASVLEWIEK